MTPRQKRALTRAGKAMAEAAAEAMNSGDACNAYLGMLARALGAAVGAATAINDQSTEELHAALERTFAEAQRNAAVAYATTLAHQRHEQGPLQ